MKRRATAAALISVSLLVTACASDPTPAGTDGSGSDGEAAAQGRCVYVERGVPARDVEPPDAEELLDDTSIVVETNLGEIAVRLLPDRAPCTVNSFLSLARQGYFDDTPCPRITLATLYVLQCGDPTGTRTGGPGYTFNSEVSGTERYNAGVLAMANANSPDSNGSQFFFVYDNSTIDPSFTIFGEVLNQDGLDVLAEIADLGTADKSPDGEPAEPVTIISVE